MVNLKSIASLPRARGGSCAWKDYAACAVSWVSKGEGDKVIGEQVCSTRTNFVRALPGYRPPKATKGVVEGRWMCGRAASSSHFPSGPFSPVGRLPVLTLHGRVSLLYLLSSTHCSRARVCPQQTISPGPGQREAGGAVRRHYVVSCIFGRKSLVTTITITTTTTTTTTPILRWKAASRRSIKRQLARIGVCCELLVVDVLLEKARFPCRPSRFQTPTQSND
ncbi:hypothetical protein LY76DRAFT_380403 [Colletotrichum caudatum]|nr:hypothetical protein LY76DRAFT_380403 [Colletotrichum caudatum]